MEHTRPEIPVAQKGAPGDAAGSATENATEGARERAPASAATGEPTDASAGTAAGVGAAFVLLAAVQAVLNTSVTLTSAVAPDIARDLSLGSSALVWTTAAYTLVFSGLLLLGGRLADRHGRRPVFVAGVALFAVASVAGALAPTGALLIAARLVQGVGAALAAPASMALVGHLFPQGRSRARALAAWGGISGVGAALGMPLGGVTATWASWRWAFVVMGVVAAAVALLAPRRVPPGPAPRTARVDVLGAALATGGIALLSYGFVAVGGHGWTSAWFLVPAVGGVALLAAFGFAENTVPEPLMPPSFFASRRRVVALVTGMFAPIAGSTTAFLMSLYFQQVLGWSSLRSAMGFVPYALALVAVSAASVPLVGRLGARRSATLGMLLMASAFLLFARITPESAYVGAPLAGMVVLPLGIGLTAAGAVTAATGDVPERQAALAGGAFNTFMLFGPTVGMALFASLADARSGSAKGMTPAEAATDGYTFAFHVAAAAFAALAVLTMWGLRGRRGGGARA
ncbi:MFS transporter [Streptodolium elevatio]